MCLAPDPDGEGYACQAELGHDGQHTWHADQEDRAPRINKPVRRWRFS